jgi:hypothetical protein
MYRFAFASLLLTTTVLLTGCGGVGTTGTAPAAGDRTAASVEPAELSTSAPTETPVESRPDRRTDDKGGDGQSTDDQGSSRNGSGSDGPSGDGTSGGTEDLPGWPIESTPVHGSQFWAAYLAVGPPGDPALQRVLEDVQRLWPGAGLGELGCDEGAAASLGRAPTEHAVAVYFATEQHISEFRRRWEEPFVGAARVTTRCAD